MTIRHLKTFIAVCDCGGITKAAETLHIAQPAVSQTVAEIEKYYGVSLFERINQRLVLTDCGKRLLVKAREAVASFGEFESLAGASEANAQLRIGSSLTIGKLYMPQIIREIREKFPQVNLSAVINKTSVIEEELAGGKLDFAMVEGAVQSKNFVSRILSHDRLIAAAAGEFALPEEITLGELIKYPLLVREKGSASRDLIDAVLAAEELTIAPFVESSSNEALISCAKRGVGIAVLPKNLLTEHTESGQLKELRVKGCDFSRAYRLIYHKNKRFGPLQLKILALCEDYFAEISGEKPENDRTDRW